MIPDHVFPDSNTANNTWTAAAGKLEKDVILDDYLGVYATANAPLKITLTEKNSALNVGISGYPSFTATPVTGEANTFEAPAARIKIQVQ